MPNVNELLEAITGTRENVPGANIPEEVEDVEIDIPEPSAPPARKKRPKVKKEKMIPTSVPISFYNQAQDLSDELDISVSEAIRRLCSKPADTFEPSVKKAQRINQLSNVRSKIGGTSADMKDIAMARLWKDMAMGGDGNGGDNFSFDKIMGFTVLMNMFNQQQMNTMMMLKQNNGDPKNADANVFLENMMAQNQNLMQAVMGAMTNNTQIQVEQAKQIGDANTAALVDAIKQLQEQHGIFRQNMEQRIAMIDMAKSQPDAQPKDVMQGIRDAIEQVKEFNNLAMQIAQTHGLSNKETEDVKNASELLNLEFKSALASRALGFIDKIGVPVAHAAGKMLGSKVFGNGNGGKQEQEQQPQDDIPPPPPEPEVEHPQQSEIKPNTVLPPTDKREVHMRLNTTFDGGQAVGE